VANLRKANGDWMIDEDTLVVTGVSREPELQIVANDSQGRRWNFLLGDGTTEASPQDLVGQRISKVVALAAGELRLEFSEGTVASVGPRDDVEAWEIRCDEESVLIGAPTGGGVIAF
jgi:Family of unknown function (DUF6188)